VLADLPRGCSKNARDGQKLGESFKCARVVQDPHSPTPVSGQVPKDGVIEDAGALVNEKITDVACLPGDNGCV
jgi:hypothetical protein